MLFFNNGPVLKLRKLYTTIVYNFNSALKMDQILKPPENIKGMTVLNKRLFEKTIKVPCIDFKNTISVSSVKPLVKNLLLKIHNFKPIVNTDGATQIYLNPMLVSDWENLHEDVRKGLEGLEISRGALTIKDVNLEYQNYSAEDLMRAILPNNKEGTSSFTKIGHIVHVNLKEHLLPYKDVIGEILHDKVPKCRTVVNKVNIIDNTYRNFQMELLKGDNDMIATLKENNCTFQFDFSKVYWNSRLCTEHERIISKLKQGDVLFDIFAGVGPFSIPAAKKKCTVFANDLNPESYNWLNFNKKGNKIKDEFLRTYKMDGRVFIKEIVQKELPKFWSKNVYITMNLPAMATEFLDAFVGLFSNIDLPENFKPPTIFVYCFSKGEDYVNIAKKLVVKNFKCNHDITRRITDVFRVRTVSSMKEMMRVTIRLDEDILCDKKSNKRKIDGEIEENSFKKSKYCITRCKNRKTHVV